MHNKGMAATTTGIIPIFFWSATGIMMCFLSDLPPLQVLWMTQGFGALVMISWSAIRGGWRQLIGNWKVTLLLALCFGGNQLCYMFSYGLAPPEQLELIAYLWPLLVVLGGILFLKDRLSTRLVVGIALAFGGIAFLILGNTSAQDFSLSFLPGHLLALLAALSWTAYSLIARHQGASSSQTLGSQLAITALVAFALQWISGESFAPLGGKEWSLVAIYGLTVNAIGIAIWGFAMRRGHVQLLQVLAYATPLLAVGWLVVFGKAPVSWELLVATLGVTLGSLCAREPQEAKVEETEEDYREAA